MDKYLKHRIQSYSLGVLFTVLLQSSSASTIMFIGFAGGGIISLFHSLSLIIGSNVGSALTIFLLSFEAINVVELLAVLVLIGLLIKLIAKKPKLKNIGSVLIGFGLLFCGLVFLGYATDIFKSYGLNSFMQSVTNPLLLILIGILVTTLIQSTMGTLAILISLMASGAISLFSACFIIFGTNIGTCVTGLFLWPATNRRGKQTALFHLLFNIFGTIVFGLLMLTPWLNVISSISSIASIQVSLINLIFNFVISLILLPFLRPLCKFMDLLIKEKDVKTKNVYFMNDNELLIPTIAIKRLNLYVYDLFSNAKNIFNEVNEITSRIILKSSRKLNNFVNNDREINELLYSYTIRLSGELSPMDHDNIEELQYLLNCHKQILLNIEDMLENLSSKVLKEKTKKYNSFSQMFAKTQNIYENIMQLIHNIYKENIKFDKSTNKNEINKLFDTKIDLEIASSSDIISNNNYSKETAIFNYYSRLWNIVIQISNYLCDFKAK